MSPERDQVTCRRGPSARAGRFVPKGKERQVRAGEPGDQDRADDLERAREVLEQLEEREEVPLGSRRVVAGGSAGASSGAPCSRRAEHDHRDEEQEHAADVDRRAALGKNGSTLVESAVARRGDSVLAEERQVAEEQGHDERGQDGDVQRVRSG